MKKLLVTASALLFPGLALAAAISDLNGIIGFVQSLLNAAMPLLIGIAVVWLIYNIVRYVVAGDDTAKEQAKQRVVYGVVGLFIIVSIWGLVTILVNTFGLTNTVRSAPNVPVVPTGGL
jgi:uncharacterized membrane protein YuzA (DUF378 family)